MPKILDVSVDGLRCDAMGCGWRDMSIPRRDYPKWRNAPCPNCSANLLTDVDYAIVVRAERIAAVINKWFGWLAWFRRDKTLHTFATVDLNGTGQVAITPVKR